MSWQTKFSLVGYTLWAVGWSFLSTGHLIVGTVFGLLAIWLLVSSLQVALAVTPDSPENANSCAQEASQRRFKPQTNPK